MTYLSFFTLLAPDMAAVPHVIDLKVIYLEYYFFLISAFTHNDLWLVHQVQEGCLLHGLLWMPQVNRESCQIQHGLGHRCFVQRRDLS